MNKWDLEEFVKILNERVPKNTNTGDKRIADKWNARLIRNYTTENKISAPFKEGRKAYYTDKHLEEVQALSLFQNIGLSSKKLPNSGLYHTGVYSSILKEETQNIESGLVNNLKNPTTGLSLSASLCSNSLTGSNITNQEKAFSLLRNINESPVVEEKIWKKVEIINGIELMVEKEHWHKIEVIKQQLKNIK